MKSVKKKAASSRQALKQNEPVRIMCWGASTAKATGRSKPQCCELWRKARQSPTPGKFLRDWFETEYPNKLTTTELQVIENWPQGDLFQLIDAVLVLCGNPDASGPVLTRTKFPEPAMLLLATNVSVFAMFLHPKFRLI